MALGCAVLSLALLLSTLPAALRWGQAQLDTGALLCADTLRFHIRADSDSPADQTTKLAVRDAVLAYADVHCTAQDKPAALRWAAESLPALELTARAVLARRGIFSTVTVQLVEMYFDTTRYSTGILPRRAVIRLCASTWAATPATAKTGGACSTRACAALPAAAMPGPPKTTLCAGSTSSGSGWWNGCSSAPPAGRTWCYLGNARRFRRIACGERSV